MNDVAQGNVFAEADGSFSINVILMVGNNDIRVAAWDGNQEGLSATHMIEFTELVASYIIFSFFGDDQRGNVRVDLGSGLYLTFWDNASVSIAAFDENNQAVPNVDVVLRMPGTGGSSGATSLTLTTNATGSASGVLLSPSGAGSNVRFGVCEQYYDRHRLYFERDDGSDFDFVIVSHSTSNFNVGSYVLLNDTAYYICS